MFITVNTGDKSWSLKKNTTLGSFSPRIHKIIVVYQLELVKINSHVWIK